MHSINDLLDIIRQSNSQCDIAKVERAYKIAEAAHKGQLRKSGDPYISHPVEVAVILAGLRMDTASISAALLHDVVEDTSISLGEIAKEFGEETAELVDGVTKLKKVRHYSAEEYQADNVIKMLMAMSKNPRVMIIKLADRLHNMRTLEHLPEDKRRIKARETLDVYAHLAHRMGIRTMKDELEDISLIHIDPIASKEIAEKIEKNEFGDEAFLKDIQKRITERLEGKFENLSVEGRLKSAYGIFRKYSQGRELDDIHDVYAVRVLVNTSDECYRVLGELHSMFEPIQGRFKDYLSEDNAKSNGYRSLHTTLKEKEKATEKRFEVQIRTWEMHQIAEYGIAAHWKYKKGGSDKDLLKDKMVWAGKLLESNKESSDAREIIDAIKSDLADEIAVYTPKGKVINLPTGASVVDFAYAIHTEVGNRMVGATVDGRMVSLDTRLETGQTINIFTTNDGSRGPNLDWIGFVRTSSARSKIRSWFKRERREESIALGRAEIERAFKRNNILLDDKELEEFLAMLAKVQKLNTTDDFLAAIGYGGISLSKIMPTVQDFYKKTFVETDEEKLQKLTEKSGVQNPKKASSEVIVDGSDNLSIKFKKCCYPIPGDEIVGFITRGHGLSVHKADCVNVDGDKSQAERLVKCEWNKTLTNEKFLSTVNVVAVKRPGLLSDIATTLNNMRVSPDSFVAQSGAPLQLTLKVNGTEQLAQISKALSKIDGVERVERSMQ